MRKRNKTSRGSRSGRGNSRGSSTNSKNVTESSVSNPSTTVGMIVPRNGLNGISSCYIRSPSTRGRRGGSAVAFPNASSIHNRSLFTASSSSSAPLRSSLESDATARGVVGAGLSRNFALANDNCPPSNNSNSKTIPVSSDYYLHKKFKKLTTTLSAEKDEEGQSQGTVVMNESSGASGNSASVSASASGSDIVNATTGLNLNDPTSKNSLSPLNHIPSSCNEDSKNGNILSLSLYSNSIPQQTNCASSSSQSNHNHYHSSTSTGITTTTTTSASPSELLLPINLASSNSVEDRKCEAVNLSSHGVSSNTPTTSVSGNSNNNNNSSSGTVVYKPKFRIAPDATETIAPTKSSSSSSSSISSSDELSLSVPDSSSSLPLSLSSSTESSLPGPGRIGREVRMDRQSLDDRISKIIDNNQSILSHWPEHLTKRLKSHVQKRQQQQQQQIMQLQQSNSSSSSPSISQFNQNQNQRSLSGGSNSDINNTMVMMSSGGSIGTESQTLGSSGGGSSNHSIGVPNNFSSHAGLNLKQSISSLSSPLLTTIPLSPALLRSHSDGVVTGGLNHHINIAEQSKKLFGDNFSEYAFPNGSNVVVGSGHNNSSSGGSGNNSNSNDGNVCTMVPKKRRRLSPTPNRLCGGEVSELPSHEASKPSLVSGRNHSGYFQDVDMTVRMSNCGTSGAKVTIRTNSSSSTNSSGSNNSNSGPSPFSYNRLMDVQSSPLKLQSVSSLPSSSPPNIQQSSSLLMRAAAVPAYFEHKSLPDTTHCLKLASPAGPGPDAGPIDLKVVGGSVSIGRLPKKGRLHIEPLRIPGPEPSPKLSVIVSPSPSILESPRVTKLSLESPLPLPLSLKRSPTTGTTAISLSALPSDFSNNASDLTAASKIKNEPVTPGSFSTISVQENDFQTPSPTPKAVTSSSPTLSPKPLVLQTTAPNPKRPNFLALKPMNALPKASVPGALPSPETPRGAKSYNQMYINGHAYTSLVFKVSTRSSYTCLFKPQPMFLPQESDPKLSMYSNWQPRPRNKNQEDPCSPQNDSRVNDRKSPCNFIFTSAGKEKGETETVNSPDQHTSRWALVDPSYTPSPSPTPTPTSTTPTPSTSMTGNINERTTSPPASSSRQSELSISNNNSQSPSPLMISVANNGSGKSTALPLPNMTSPLSIQSPGTLPSRIDYNNGYNSNLQRPLDLFTGNASASMKDKFPASSFQEDKKNKPNIGSDSPGESPCSSADESNMSFSGRFSKGNTNSNGCHNASLRLQADRTVQERMSNGLYPDQDGPLSLTVNNCGSISNNSNNSHRDYLGESLHSNDDDGDDDQHSVGIIDGRFENPRVRIMEGGFESNEDYTYVRGRGRGRYVCEACGIRCKKPSMLRKHLKTHTDLRPYTCKLCNFSFKTKGNLTKHQKSKSHHKKCIGLGIHPNSSRSLAMIGPSFSDTNTDDSEDEDDPGIYNGADTDSQEDIDTEELSSSAEPDQMTRESSHSVENEIAQSLLDLSRTNRIPRDIGAAGPDDLSRPLGLDSPLKPIQNQRLIQHARCNGYSPKNLGIDENSCSQASIGSSTAPEVPIDLSCRSKTISTSSTNDMDDEMESSDFKRLKLEKNSFIRSFGVVGEAQRWEPEEEFLITGCLNLKKIPNESNKASEDKSGSNVGTPSDKSIILADVKPEIRSLNLYSNNNVGEKPFDLKLETKRKRESSTSSSCGGENYLMAPLPQSPVIQLQSSSLPPSGAPTPLVHGLPPSQTNSSGPSSQNCSNLSSKQQKLHQPWLSPRESRAPENAEGARPPVAPVETQISTSLNGEHVENKVIDTLDKPREPARPALTSDHSGQNKLGHAPVTSIPNTTAFSTLVGLKPQAEFRQPSGPQALVKDEGKAECNVCGKTFARASQLNLHMNIHYLERPFRCDPCGVSFRTKGHLIKHRRSSSHDCKVKVYLTESWGVANEENPRPFKCPDCKIAFRIHGHLAKHLRSKMHIMRMECLGKLPFGIYFEMEKSGLNLTEIDTSDCDMSLISLQGVAKKIYGDSWTDRLSAPIEESV